MLDEPLDSLDLPNQAAVTALVQRICRDEGVAVLLVAHDVNPLLPYLDQVIYLAGGRALQGPVREVITGPNAQRALRRADRGAAHPRRTLVVVGQPEAPARPRPRTTTAAWHMAPTALLEPRAATCASCSPTSSWSTRCRRGRSWP